MKKKFDDKSKFLKLQTKDLLSEQIKLKEKITSLESQLVEQEELTSTINSLQNQLDKIHDEITKRNPAEDTLPSSNAPVEISKHIRTAQTSQDHQPKAADSDKSNKI